MARDPKTGLEVTIESERAPAPRGPEEAVLDATRRVFGGDPNGRSPEDLDAIDKRVLQEATRKARLFRFSKQEDADAWAQLQQAHFAGGLSRILRTKEIVFEIEYAQFVEWIEFKKPEEEVRADATKAQEALLAKMKPKKKEEPQKKPRRSRKAETIPPLAEPDAPPRTHQGLED